MNRVDITLYGIVDPARSLGREVGAIAAAAAAGGASLIQYRDKHGATRDAVARARAVRTGLAGSGVPLIVNDRVDVALAAGAAGVHLGQDDMHPADARSILSDRAIIGISVRTLEEARTAALDAVDYVFVGGVFETRSKDNPAAIGVDGWRELAAVIRGRAGGMPVGAIAGIDEANAGALIRAGADGVAVITALFMADDVEAATRALRRRIEWARNADAA